MTVLVGTFAFFALHTLLWLTVDGSLHERFEGMARGKIQVEDNDSSRGSRLWIVPCTPKIGAFCFDDHRNAAQVLLHRVAVHCRRHERQAVAAVLHRLGAIITIFYFSVHVISVIYALLAGRRRFQNPETGKLEASRVLNAATGPDSPMPGLQDFKDILAHNKWFFGRGPKPQFDRWTYWEKFDYMAVFWGVAIIGVSGLIMWFPETFTIVLPGWTINVAHIIHSDEALLAAGFIFTFHFFNVHFRPDKFPMDRVMFSGRISRSELMNERKKLYDRGVSTGERKHRAGHEWESWKEDRCPPDSARS
jgi:cytochrome b subunit of formate dehydrogenase